MPPRPVQRPLRSPVLVSGCGAAAGATGSGSRRACGGNGRQHALEHLVFRPEGLTSPVRHHEHESTAASALGRWAMTTQIPPRGRTPRIAWVSAFLALGVEICVRLVQHHQERIAVERAGEATRWRCPAESNAPPSPIGVS